MKAQPLHNPCTSGFSSFTSLSCGTRTTLCTSNSFGQRSFPNEHSCTTPPPNPLYKPARFNMIYHVWNCLESLYCCCVFLFRMSSDFDSRDNPEKNKSGSSRD